jgi:hypothetical protein
LDEEGHPLRNHEKPYQPELITCGGCAEIERFQHSLQDDMQKMPAAYRGAKFNLKKVDRD